MPLLARIEDSTHLRLEQPLNGKVGSLVVLEILEAVDQEDFLDSSAALLEAAYCADEPDYSNAGTLIRS